MTRALAPREAITWRHHHDRRASRDERSKSPRNDTDRGRDSNHHRRNIGREKFTPPSISSCSVLNTRPPPPPRSRCFPNFIASRPLLVPRTAAEECVDGVHSNKRHAVEQDLPEHALLHRRALSDAEHAADARDVGDERVRPELAVDKCHGRPIATAAATSRTRRITVGTWKRSSSGPPPRSSRKGASDRAVALPVRPVIMPSTAQPRTMNQKAKTAMIPLSGLLMKAITSPSR